MLIHFEKLYEVEILHNYYISGISEDFHIEPTASCKALLRNYGLLFKRTPRGFVILYELSHATHSNGRPLKPIEESIKFSFLLTPINPYFCNYSKLDLTHQTTDHIYYFHNLNENLQEKQLLLTSDTRYDHVTEADCVELKPEFFYHTFTSERSPAKIEVLDAFRNLVKLKTVPPIEGKVRFPVDLRGHHAGRYTLRINDDFELVFYGSGELKAQNVFGVIDLFHHEDVPPAYRYVTDEHEVAAKTYTLKIERRSTYWKYYLVNQYRPTDTDEPIVKHNPPGSNDSGIKFQEPSTIAFSDGTVALLFVSESALPLRKEPISHIQLVRGENHPDIDSLPNPSVRTIKPNASENKVYSEIFVYI